MDQDFHDPPITDQTPGDVNELPLQILTSGGLRIAVQPNILSLASPVLASMTNQLEIDQSSERVIRVFGVPCEAVFLFVRFLVSEKLAVVVKKRWKRMEFICSRYHTCEAAVQQSTCRQFECREC